jgi:putative FmdB family regulatory protein
MPLYEYRCEHCAKQFEATQSVHARVEDTECPFCHARQATRLLSSFASKIVGDHKPGFAELKAGAMHNERMERAGFAVRLCLCQPLPYHRRQDISWQHGTV